MTQTHFFQRCRCYWEPYHLYPLWQVSISFAKILLQVTRPRTAILGKIPRTTVYRNIQQYPEASRIPGVMIVRVDSAIYFSNSNYVKERYRITNSSFVYRLATIRTLSWDLRLYSVTLQDIKMVNGWRNCERRLPHKNSVFDSWNVTLVSKFCFSFILRAVFESMLPYMN